jgi:hypothetical protein
MSSGDSPDLSIGMNKLFKIIKLIEDSKFLIISMDLGNVGNMIQLSDKDLHDATSLFSRQDLRDPKFQDSIIKISCLEKCFSLVLKKIHGLGEHGNILGQLIHSTFSEENELLDKDNMFILKCHYMKCYLQLRMQLLDHLEDLMTQDSLMGSTVSTRSKKRVSVISRMSSPSVKSVNTETSKASESSKSKETSKIPE